MRTNMVAKVTLMIVLVMTLTSPAHAFVNQLLEDLYGIIYDRFVKPIVETVLGGGTGLVFNALTFNFLGLQPNIERIFTTVVIEGGGVLISTVAEIIWLIVSGITETIIWLVSETVQVIADIKINIIYSTLELLIQFINPGGLGLFGLREISGRLNSKVAYSADTPASNESALMLRHRRSADTDYELKQNFKSATSHDPMQCVPLVFCAIYADSEDLVSTEEAAFRKVFRPYFAEESVPDWAQPYVRAADIGATTKSLESCRETYSSCGFSPNHLRKLIAQAMNTKVKVTEDFLSDKL